jgi:hypothetical protein
MSKQEIKDEISKVLDRFSDQALGEFLSFLQELDARNNSAIDKGNLINRILREDHALLAKLAQ